MRITLTFVILIACTNLFACDCKIKSLKEIQGQSYNNSPLIFIGDVLTIDQEKGTYKIKIIEIFKGETKVQIIEGKTLSSCSGFPDIGRWIIYAETFKNGEIDFNTCGPSRSFDNPQNIKVTDYQILPLPTGHSVQANIDWQKQFLKLKETALTDLESEIEGIRKMRN